MKINFLKLEHIYKNYTHGAHQVSILKDISFTFKQGHSYALSGTSGSGKSTLMQILSGLDTPSRGDVYFNDTKISALNESQKTFFLNKSVGLMFQYPYLLKEMNSLENVMIKGLIDKQPYQDCLEQAQRLLHEVGIGALAHLYPGQLSGGQQQRVALARALFGRPIFLLADEPTGNLDRVAASQVLALMNEAHKQWGLGLIISSHDLQVTQAMESICTLKDGYLSN